MKLIITLIVLGLIASALYQKWRSISPQTKQMWAMLFGAAKVMKQAKKQMNEQANAGATQAQRAGNNSGNGATPFEFPYARNTATASSGAVYAMRACEQCGLHVPENEGVMVSGQFYCCKEHAQ